MARVRRCTRSACKEPAVATLTYVYAESTAVLGPLAVYAEPHSYDLCSEHAAGLSVPRGWEVIRLAVDETALADPLVALADAVREAPPVRPEPELVETGRRGHLRVLRDPDA